MIPWKACLGLAVAMLMGLLVMSVVPRKGQPPGERTLGERVSVRASRPASGPTSQLATSVVDRAEKTAPASPERTCDSGTTTQESRADAAGAPKAQADRHGRAQQSKTLRELARSARPAFVHVSDPNGLTVPDWGELKKNRSQKDVWRFLATRSQRRRAPSSDTAR